ncbi:divalent-cation tolerance protein CutA [Thalassovita aquimarina]|uniref:Divalent-cation tolerance protein CutA n=1 Tax=Thalassovita aquimarina TaxID=2785917 RepID=A0ABS5HW47_9RHOB|nr:divalent cation tolerance protein CutA [Thalassovita aquimarina]MBR9653150.1 divalent-cation tolerance protein CutA [Thalassovita aquimarina]
MSILVFTVTCPDPDAASDIADDLLVRRLAARATLHPPVESHYRALDGVDYSEEITLTLITRPELETAVEFAIRGLHPYDMPPILRHEERANADYEAWVMAETGG